MSLLGIDVGTSGCKAAAFSAEGRRLGAAYREYPTLRPQPGWAELDSAAVIRAVKDAIRETAAQCSGDPITALSVSSMGEAMTPVDARRRILAPCILSSDTRGGETVEAIKREIGQRAFYEINPNILGVNYSLPKLNWIRRHQPEVYERADKFLLWADMVGCALGGEAMTSYSLANRTMLFDIRRERWSDRLLELGGIDRAKLPDAKPSGTIAGTVPPAIAEELGLRPGAAIVLGGHDQCCNSLGAGIVEAGRAVCGIGTFECICPSYDFIPPAESMLAGGLNVEHHILPGLYVSFIYNQGGALLKWFRDAFASADRRSLEAGQDIYDALAAEMPSEPTRLLTLPYFEMTGPPQFVADAAGAIVGLKTSTTRGEILRSIMECETFYFVDSLERLKELRVDSSEFVATGGGAKSDAWLQIKADILGVPFARPRILECSALGAAILAGWATGVFSSPKEGVERFVAIDRVFEPNPARHETYRDLCQKYRQLYPALENLLKQL